MIEISCWFFLMSCHGVKREPIASRRPHAAMHVDQADLYRWSLFGGDTEGTSQEDP